MSIPRRTIPPQFVHTRSRWAGTYDAHQLTALSEGIGGVTWPANLGIYVPFMLPWPFPVRQVYWINGGTVTASTVDVGIYTPDGVRLYSTGATAQAGLNAPQSVSGVSLLLPPGPYLLGLAASGGASRIGGSSVLAVDMMRHAGLLQEAVSAATLPAVASFTAITNALMPMFGITRSAKTI